MINLLILLAVIGFCAYAVTTWIPMANGIKTVIIISAIIACIIIALHAFGVHLPNPSVPQVH